MKPRLRLTANIARQVRLERSSRVLFEYYEGTLTAVAAGMALQAYGFSERQIINMLKRTNDLWLGLNDCPPLVAGGQT